MSGVAVSLQKHIMEHIKLKAEEDVEAELFKQYGTDPEGLISPLQREADARHQALKARAAATRVDFFTVAREAGS